MPLTESPITKTYHLAFFVDDNRFRQDKIDAFIQSAKTPVFLSVSDEVHEISAASDLVGFLRVEDSGDIYPFPWFLHGGLSRGTGLTHVSAFQPCHPLTLQEADAYFRSLAEKYLWALSAWGLFGRLMALAFVTTNPDLRDRFVSCSKNRAVPYWGERMATISGTLSQGASLPSWAHAEHEMFISGYEVTTRFNDYWNAVVFEPASPRTTGHLLWNACQRSESHPMLIFPDTDVGSSAGRAGPSSTDRTRDVLWKTYDGFPLLLKQTPDESDLVSHCDQWATMVVSSGEAPVPRDKLQAILHKRDGDELWSDLCLISEYLKLGDWVFVNAGDGIEDYYPMLLARDSVFLNEFLKLAEGRIQLRSCF